MSQNWLARLYLEFWYRTEFWWTPVNRRPYTFIMKDWLNEGHQLAFILMVAAWYITLWFEPKTASILQGTFGAMLLAHLVWGAPWIEHEHASYEDLAAEGVAA